MNYKSENIEDLARELKEGVVTFEYVKLDGTARVAKGTMREDYIPEKIPDILELNKDAIDALMVAKNIRSIDEYAKENGLEYMGIHGGTETTGEDAYVFSPIKDKRKLSEKTLESMFTYYDVEKDAFRSFKKENFKGIIE